MIGWALAMVLSVPAPAASRVVSYELKAGEVYTVNVAENAIVSLRFPFECRKPWFIDDLLDVMIRGKFVLIATQPNVALGTVTKAIVDCGHLSVPLELVVTGIDQASPQIDFRYKDGEQSLVESALQTAATCDRRLQEARRGNQRAQLEAILSRARQAFSEHHDRESGRAGSVIVHVDAQKRLGDIGIIEFRVQNRETGPVKIDEVEVAAVGSVATPEIIRLGDAGPEDPAPIDGDVEGLGDTVAAVVIPATLLKPGATVGSSVAFPWPSDATRFTLTVRVTAPDSRAIEVKNIDF